MDTDPTHPVLWRSGSRRLRSEQESARWHRKEDGYAQYFSLSTGGAWAEWIRARGVTTPAEAEHTLRNMYECCVIEVAIADWRTPDRIRKSGLDPTLLIGPHGPCQELAGWLVSKGFHGVLSPNAALEGAINLALFGPREERHLDPWESFGTSTPLGPDEIEIRLAEHGGHPPTELLTVTRRRDAPSSTYTTWPTESDGLPRTSA